MNVLAWVAHFVAAGLLLTPVQIASPALGSVSGELTLLERPGAVRNDIAGAVIYLQPIDVRDDGEPGTVPTESIIAMRGREFLPHTTVVRLGGVVRFPNQDPFSHNVFSNTAPVSFDLGLYRRGATREATFGEAGVYPIYCNIHAKMVSYVITVPTRHVTRADAAGRFVLGDVPVGAYRVHVWHERAARVAQDITTAASGTTVKLTLDARGYVPGAHLNKFGMPYAASRADRY